MTHPIRAWWLVGATLGLLAAFGILVLGLRILIPTAALLTLAALARPSLALVSGVLVGLGGTWLAMMGFAVARCDAFNSASNQACQGFGLEPFAAAAAAICSAGLVLGVIALHR